MEALVVPPGLDWWGKEPGGEEFLAALRGLVGERAREWELEVGPPSEPASISLAAPAGLPDGSGGNVSLLSEAADARGDLRSDPSPARRIRRRLEVLSARLGLDRERMHRWGIALALAWGMTEERVETGQTICAKWLSEA